MNEATRQHVARIVSSAPPISREKMDRIAVLLRGVAS